MAIRQAPMSLFKRSYDVIAEYRESECLADADEAPDPVEYDIPEPQEMTNVKPGINPLEYLVRLEERAFYAFQRTDSDDLETFTHDFVNRFF